MPGEQPGVTENKDGSVVIQGGKRSDQLEGIAAYFKRVLSEHVYDNTHDYHRAMGYCEQLQIIAEELRQRG